MAGIAGEKRGEKRAQRYVGRRYAKIEIAFPDSGNEPLIYFTVENKIEQRK